MKRSLVILALAGFFLATSLNNSQADPADPPPWIPRPEPELRVPVTFGAEMEDGHVVFAFGGGRGVYYNISWTRGIFRYQGNRGLYYDDPFTSGVGGTKLVANTDIFNNEAGQFEVTGYTIPEKALPGTFYYIRVQAVGRDGTRTKFVENSFFSPPGPTSKARVTDKTVFDAPGPSPFSNKIGSNILNPSPSSKILNPSPSSKTVDNSVRLKPSPIIGKNVLTPATQNPSLRLGTGRLSGPFHK